MLKRLKTITFLALAFLALNSPGKVKAQEQFDISHDVTYQVDQTGVTTVQQNIEIENKEENVMATTYSVTVKQMDIFDVTGSDEKGQLGIDVKRDNEKGSTIINAKLNNKAIGKGSITTLAISYKTNDLANKVGSIWNINLPKTANLGNTKGYKAKLLIPDEFGPLIYISPTPEDTGAEQNYKTFSYSKENLSGEAVTASFGINQMVNFELNYHLENKSILPNKQEIALPPVIKGQQEIYYKNIEPKPNKIYIDQDGNVMAIFKVKRNSNLKIRLTGSAKISGKQINPEFGGKMYDLPKDLVKAYTKEQIFWETESEKIQEIADELFDPNKTVAENAEKAYKYVTDNLEYNFDIVQEDYIERQGALKALTMDDTWACMEFTDLFIAITRAMGIPARELNGYAFSDAEDVIPVSIDLKGGDMLHAWAEFYDPNFGWIPVDPTWGTTSGIDYFSKLDTNHLAFVVKGTDSQYPYPAGSYRIDPEEKQINVAFAENKIDFTPKVEVKKAFNWNVLKLLQKKERYVLTHQEGPALYDLENTGKYLLPFQSETIYLKKENSTINYKNYNNIEKKLKL